MRIRVIPAAELPGDLQAAWRRIQAADPALVSPYFCPEYTQLVAQVREPVFVGIAEERSRLVGFFPFERRRRGFGRPAGGPLSDCQAFIVEPGLEWSAADLVRQCGLRVWDFDHLLRAQTPFAPFAARHAESPVMDLSAGYAAYRAARRRETLQLNKVDARERKLIEQVGPLRYLAHTADPRVFATLVEWKRAQYQRTGKLDVLSFPWTVALLERVVAAQAPTFAGLLSALYAGDRLIAVHLGMRSTVWWHSWFPAFDRDFEKFSPGLLLLLKMAQDAQQLGLRAIDLGKGDDGYKRQLANAAIPLCEGSVELPSFRRTARRLRRRVEHFVRGSALRHVARLPGRMLRRAERMAQFR